MNLDYKANNNNRPLDEEKQHEQAWMADVNDLLYVDCDIEKHTPAMWSSFHSSPSDTIGQPQKCIDALLPIFNDKLNDPTYNGTGEKEN